MAHSYDEEDEALICTACNGSGEGMHDGTSCHSCHGRGVETSCRDDDDFDPPEPEYCDEEGNILL